MARPGQVIHVEGPLWVVVAEGQGRFPRSHSVLLRDRITALIDTGCGIDVLRALRAEEKIDLVINTHTHPDHSAGNFLFSDRAILVPEPGADTSGNLMALSDRFFDDEQLRPIWREFIREKMGFEDQRPTGNYRPGDQLRVGDTVLEVVHAPGHTVDHCCFFDRERGVLISADIDLTRFGPWYGHPESSLALFRRSIELVASLEPSVVISSHRPPLRQKIPQAFEAFLSTFDEREARLLEFLARDRSMNEIVDAALVYGRFPYLPPVTRYWEAQMIGKHLHDLETRSLIEQRDRSFRAL